MQHLFSNRTGISAEFCVVTASPQISAQLLCPSVGFGGGELCREETAKAPSRMAALEQDFPAKKILRAIATYLVV